MKFGVKKGVQLNRLLLGKALLILLIIAAVFCIASYDAHAIDFSAVPLGPNGDTQVKLDWSSVPGAQAYRLWRRTEISPNVRVTTINVLNTLDSLTYTDTGLDPNTKYTYLIKAFYDVECTKGIEQKETSVTTDPMISPYDVKAVFDINTRKVTLTWKASMKATGATITRYEGTNPPIAADTATSAVINESGTGQIRYTIRSTGTTAEGDTYTSGPSDLVTVQPIAVPALTAVYSNGFVHITSNTDTDFSRFRLMRSKWKWNVTSWGDWEKISDNFLSGSYYDSVSAEGQYRYRLEAHSGYSGYSNVTEHLNALGAPSNLVAEFMVKRISLTWTNAEGNSASIKVFRSIAGGAFTEIATLPADTETYFDNSVTVVPGTVYSYRVMAYDESSGNYSQSATTSLSGTLPPTPTSLRADVSSSDGVKLTWTCNQNNVEVFVVERMTSPGQFQPLGEFWADPAGSSTVTYTDNTVTAGNTYIYRVYAINALGNSSYSNEVTVSAWDAVAPATLTVTAVSSSRIDLAWSYSGKESYNTVIERKVGSTGTWTRIYTTALGAVKYTDTGLSPNTRYFYRIRKSLGSGSLGVPYPNDEIGIGAYTLISSLSLSGQAASGNTIYLTWSGNSDSDVVIERKMPNGSFSELTTVNASTTGWYDDTGLIPGASYTYRIKAKTATNESLYSAECTVQNFYLEAPSNLGISVDTNSAIVLKWDDNSTDESGFEIWRSTNDNRTYELYDTLDKNITTYTDTAVHKGIQYYYKVRSYIASDGLYSSFSNAASTGVGLINPPSNLRYTYISNSKVLLEWKDNSSNESGFMVERKIGSDGTWSVVQWLSANKTSYTATNLNVYTEYYYRVRAYRYSRNADSLSEEIMVSTAIPAAPSDVTAKALSTSQVKITWKDNSDIEDGFRIMRKLSTGVYSKPLAEVTKDTTSFIDNTVQAGKRYYYKVVAYNNVGSLESKEAGVSTDRKVYFDDLGNVLWAADAIENLAGRGIIKGVSQTHFAPNRTMTKAEFTAIVVRAFGFNTAPIGSIADVKSDKWYHKEVMIAENLGVIEADSKNRFYPEAAITREEIAMILFKALEASGQGFNIHDNSTLEKFIDKNNISSAAVSGMATLVGEGIIEGMPGNIIGPKYSATRAQAAVMLFRTLNKIQY